MGQFLQVTNEPVKPVLFLHLTDLVFRCNSINRTELKVDLYAFMNKTDLKRKSWIQVRDDPMNGGIEDTY